MTESPIGMLDSGLGGLSILREVRRHLPEEDVVFIADQAHVPYGPRPLAQVREFSVAITRLLLAMGAKAIVVAGNTAPAAGLRHWRNAFPHAPLLRVRQEGVLLRAMGGAGTVRVLATPTTFQ